MIKETVPLLHLEGISRYYQAGDTLVKALDDISLTIWPGEFIAIMGQSGSGKSTLMNILGCLDRPSKGRYHILGRDVAQIDRNAQATLRRDTFGFIFQRYNLLATATVGENVEMPTVYAGLRKAIRWERVKFLLNKLEIHNRISYRPHELSGGQQQRVAIARALVNDPLVILADEPTGALDSHSGKEVMSLLQQLNGEGKTVILITHDDQVAHYAHRCIRIADGKIVSDSGRVLSQPTPMHLSSHSQHANWLTTFFESWKMAIRALYANLFRTLLTLLGIIIGVAAVVVMMAVGDGSKQKVLDQISAMGTNLLIVRPGTGGIRASGDIVTLVASDGKAIESLPNVEAVVPQRNGRLTARYGNADYTTNVTSTNEWLPVANNWPIITGTFFDESDLRSMAPVAVLGETVRQNLFPEEENPIGQYILIKNIPFEVIGTMSVKGASSYGTDQDDVIFVPLTTAMVRLFGTRNYLSSLMVKVAELSRIEETKAQVHAMILARHKIEDFSIRNLASIIQAATDTQNTLTVLLGVVAAISLLVGGIGVMNIMLVNVTERTREIGIRMATGARTRDILLQFNTEAVVVCLTGGTIGVVTGIGITLLLKHFDIAILLKPGPMILAFSCAVATGLIFGYLPARKAARMDPVTALATE